MAKALSMRGERDYILRADREEAARRAAPGFSEAGEGPPWRPTRWTQRRLRAAEWWELRDGMFEVTGAVQGVAKGEEELRMRSGWREQFILDRTTLGVSDLEDPDRPGEALAYPGPQAAPSLRAQFWDRIPAAWRSEIAEAAADLSEISAEQEGNSGGSPPASTASRSERPTP